MPIRQFFALLASISLTLGDDASLIPMVEIALKENQSIHRHSKSSDLLMLSLRVDEQREMPESLVKSGEVAHLHHVVQMAVPLNNLTKVVFIRYEQDRPRTNSEGMKILGYNRNMGMIKHENGSWKHYLKSTVSGDNLFPVDELIIYPPGDITDDDTLHAFVECNPFEYGLFGESKLLHMPSSNPKLGFIGLLTDFASKRGGDSKFVEENGKKYLSLSNQHKDSTGEASQIIEFDQQKLLAPFSYKYVENSSEPKKFASRWNIMTHRFRDDVGWLPTLIEREIVQSGDLKKISIKVDSVELIDTNRATELMQEPIGIGWTVDDRIIGKKFQLGGNPQQIIDTIEKLEK